MIRVTTFAGKRVAVFGLGGSGLATVRALEAGGAKVAAWDDSAPAREEAGRAGAPLLDLSTADWPSFAALALSPGVPLTHPEPHWTVRAARAANVQVIGDMELFAQERAAVAPDAPLITITGTNGKSTTTALIGHLLAAAGRDAAVGGNIGTPVLALPPPASNRVHVLEVSSFQIDLAPSLAPYVGVLLNLSPDHLDRHGTMGAYAAIKARLVAAADHAVIGADDDWCRDLGQHLARERPGRVSAFSAAGPIAQGWHAEGQRLLADGTAFADLTGIGTLRGRHNAQNALAAAIAAHCVGLSPAEIAAGLKTYPGLPHRLEEVGRRGRVLLINDSKATNADSTEKALASFPGGIFWILGGKAKAGGIESLRPYFGRIARAYLIGEATEPFAATLGDSVPFVRAGTLDAALARAADDAATSGAVEPVVLLSPACASYDQFRNFAERGDRFRTLVQGLPGVTATGGGR